MDRFQLMQVFVAVAESGGFAAAARRLHCSPPVVTRAVAALEAHLGVPLLVRTTRSVRVTGAGARYLDDARRLLAELADAEAAAAGANAAPRGELAVTAPVLFGRLFVTPVIAAYLDTWPAATVSALFVDRVVNFADEGMDVGVRIGVLPDSALRAIAVGKVRRVVVGAPAYFATHGVPAVPEDLAAHRIVAASGITPTHDWRFEHAGRAKSVRVAPRFSVNTNDAAIAAARRGLGLARVLSYQVADAIARGELSGVLDDWAGEALPVHVIHREGRQRTARVRAFVELAVNHLRAEPALNA